MPVTKGNANSLVKEFMAFQTLWESQKNDPKSDTVESESFQIMDSYMHWQGTVQWIELNYTFHKVSIYIIQ